MELELKQVISQIIAFLLMLWILKKLAWKPILQVMEDRRRTIEEQFEAIEIEKREIHTLRTTYDEKLKNIDSEAKSRQQESIREGRKLAENIQQTARQQSQELLAQAKEQIEREMHQAKVQLKNSVVDIAIAATEKILEGHINSDQHKALLNEFVNEAELK